MMNFIRFTSLILICVCYAKGQENGTFGDFDLGGLGGLNFNDASVLSIVNQLSIDRICEVVNRTEQDNICFRQLAVVCGNENFRTVMMDANSKFPYTGMLVKTRLDLGSYDECIQLDLTENGTRVQGKHCLGGLMIPDTTELANISDFDQFYKLSTCIPNECDAEYLLELMNLSRLYPLFNTFFCNTRDSNTRLEWADYAAIVFFCGILLILVTATGFDLYYSYTSSDSKQLWIRAFSMYNNGKKLFKVSKSSAEQIQVIHGLRVISMMWIVLGHSFSTLPPFPGINGDALLNFAQSRPSMYITTAYLAVDTFFFISGFLLAWQYLKAKPTSLSNHVKRVPAMVLHRYIRITPVVLAAFIFTTTLFMHLGDGPLYKITAQKEKDACLDHWWSLFTYTQNYVNYDQMCMMWTWYLAADWQLFLISPVVLIPVAVLVKGNFKWVMGELVVLNLIFTLLPVAVKFLLEDYENQYEAHTRLNAYFIGFMFGVFMRENNNAKYMFSMRATRIIWLSVLVIMFLTALAYKEIQLVVELRNDKSFNTYFVFLRASWCLGLGWIVYACHNGYGGFINWMLSTPFVQVLSKLTFCMYMTHACPIIYQRLIIQTPIDFGQIIGIKEAIVAYVMTVGFSILATLAFESPLITLEKYFLGGHRT